jgi:hypothetical protein
MRSKLYGQPAYAPPEDGSGGGGTGVGGTGNGATGGAGSGAGSNPGGTGGATPAAWHANVAADIRDLWAAKSWDHSDPAKLAVTLTENYRNVEKFIGAPADQIIRLPKADDAAGFRALWTKLGAPQDATGYDLSGVKFADGKDLDAPFVESFRAAALAHGLTKEAAGGMAGFFTKFMDGVSAGEAAESTAALTREQEALKQNWGANFEANKFVASQAAAKLGVKPEQVAALEKVVGYAKVMEMFRDIGVRTGEAKYVAGEGAGGNPSGVMSVDQAVARRTELMKDPVWAKAYLGGGATEAREMLALNTIISSASVRRAA